MHVVVLHSNEIVSLWVFFLTFIFIYLIYLFGRIRSQLQQVQSLVGACGIYFPD